MNEHTEQVKNHLVEFDEPFVEPKRGAAALLFASRFPPALRKFGRGAAVYALSYAAVKILDAAAEKNQKNGFIVGADQVANAVFFFENLIVGGVVMIAAAGYEAATRPKTMPETKQQAEPSKVTPHIPKHRHHRNRAPLNAKLAPDVLSPAPPAFGNMGSEATPVPKSRKEMPEAPLSPRPTPLPMS